jgi:hypothetical protein
VTACARATRLATLGLILLPVIASLAACERKTQAKAVEARPVCMITAHKSDAGETVMLTGQTSAENKVPLAFHIGGPSKDSPAPGLHHSGPVRPGAAGTAHGTVAKHRPLLVALWLERTDSALRQWRAAGFSLPRLTIMLGVAMLVPLR